MSIGVLSFRKLLVFFCFLGLGCHLNADNPKAEPKLLVLIIASDNHPAFLELQEIWRSYRLADPEHVEIYFLKGDPEMKEEAKIVGDTLYTKVLDSYKPGITKKTLASMKYFHKNINDYDYVLRTNLSSFYHFPRLLSFLKTLPKTTCYAAWPLTPHPGDVTPKFYNVPFGSGAGFILSPDLVSSLVEGSDEILEDSEAIPDDVVIGAYLHRKGVKITPTGICMFSGYEDWKEKKDNLPLDAFHFRAKKGYQKRSREDEFSEEIKILKELVAKFYRIKSQSRPQQMGKGGA